MASRTFLPELGNFGLQRLVRSLQLGHQFLCSAPFLQGDLVNAPEFLIPPLDWPCNSDHDR